MAKIDIKNFLWSGWDLKSHKPGSHKPGAVQTEVLGYLKLKKPVDALPASRLRPRQSIEGVQTQVTAPAIPTVVNDDARVMPERVASRASAKFASARQNASSAHAAMLMCFIDSTRQEASFSAPGSNAHAEQVQQALRVTYDAIAAATRTPPSAESLPSWEAWKPECVQALSMLRAGWDATPVLRDIPFEHRHRFIIDADKLKAFESEAAAADLDVSGSPIAGFLFTEPGYLLGAANAYKAAFETQGPTDSALVNRVHRAISDANPQMSWGIKQGTQCILVDDDKFGDEGFSDLRLLCKELQTRDGTSAIDLSPANSSGSAWRTGSKPETTAASKATIIDRWAEDRDAALKKIGNDPSSAPLRAVAVLDFLAKCIRLHAHEDGNGRMYQQILLNRELDRAGLPLCILPKPGDLHIKGLAEMLLAMRKGMLEAGQYVSCAHPQKMQVLRDLQAEDAGRYVQEYRARFAWDASSKASVAVADDDCDDDLHIDVGSWKVSLSPTETGNAESGLASIPRAES